MGSFKRKSDIINALTNLFSNPELKEAGIDDALEYIIPDLSAKELNNYLKFARNELAQALKPILDLRKQLPDNVWKTYKSLGYSNTETRLLKRHQESLVKVWKKKPKVADRVIDDPAKERTKKHSDNAGFNKNKE